MPLPIRKTGKKGKRLKDLIPSNARWFLADLLGINKTFTEKDLTSNELSFLQDLILNKPVVEKETSGGKNFPISFYDNHSKFEEIRDSHSLFNLIKQSYDPYKSMATTLGQAQLSKDKEGNIIISDNYDFNWFADVTKNMRPQDVAKGFFGQLRKGNPFQAFGVLGGRFGTSQYEETGNPVRINLGKSDNIKKRWKKDEKLEQQMENFEQQYLNK